MEDVQTRPPLRVLLVDDYPDTTSTMAVLIGYWGHDVRVANDGPQALTIARDYQPDVIFLDTAMPGMDGHEVARRLREDLGLASAFLVGMSGYGSEADQARGREAGYNEFLLKPVDPDLIRRLLESRQSCGKQRYGVAASCCGRREQS